MTTDIRVIVWTAVLVPVLLLSRAATGGETVSPEVKGALKAMSEKLSGAGSVKMTAKRIASKDFARANNDIEEASFTVWVLRPDRMKVEFVGKEQNLQIFFDGKKFSLFDVPMKAYGVAPLPGTIDEMLSKVSGILDISIQRPPAGVLLGENPLEQLLKGVKSGAVTGEEAIGEVSCKRVDLVFEDRVTKIWIGPDHLPKRFSVTLTKERENKSWLLIRCSGSWMGK